jgi:hypothetical protein
MCVNPLAAAGLFCCRCRPVNVKLTYGALGRGTNIILRRAWVLACVLLFVAWISFDIGIGADSSVKDRRVLPKWPSDTLLTSLLEPYSIKQQSLDYVEMTYPLDAHGSVKDGVSLMCMCTYSDKASETAGSAPYVELMYNIGHEGRTRANLAWALLNLCEPRVFNLSSEDYTMFERLEKATHVYSAYVEDILYIKGYAPATSYRLDLQGWRMAMFMEFTRECCCTLGWHNGEHCRTHT